jgi:hypothetical protein
MIHCNFAACFQIKGSETEIISTILSKKPEGGCARYAIAGRTGVSHAN